MLAFSRFPLDPLEVEDKNGVEDRNQQKGREGSEREPADLGIAERLPERAAFECEWKQSKDRCAYRDHHRANALDPGIRKSALQRLALLVHLLDEIEQYDDMADNDADQTRHAEKGHEPKRSVHHGQRNQGSDRTIRRCREHKKRFDGIVELDEKCKIDANE